MNPPFYILLCGIVQSQKTPYMSNSKAYYKHISIIMGKTKRVHLRLYQL